MESSLGNHAGLRVLDVTFSSGRKFKGKCSFLEHIYPASSVAALLMDRLTRIMELSELFILIEVRTILSHCQIFKGMIFFYVAVTVAFVSALFNSPTQRFTFIDVTLFVASKHVLPRSLDNEIQIFLYRVYCAQLFCKIYLALYAKRRNTNITKEQFCLWYLSC